MTRAGGEDTSSSFFINNGANLVTYPRPGAMHPLRAFQWRENDESCKVCLNGDSLEGNPILFCDKCNVAVHQHCYQVKEIPDGDWLCKPCEEGLNTETLRCQLCPTTGGAYRKTSNGRWVHDLCANWIPELGWNEQEEVEMNSLNKKRLSLKCVICKRKSGACIQCGYKKCTVSYHPMCANLTNDFKCTTSVDEKFENRTRLISYCPEHSNIDFDQEKKRKLQVISTGGSRWKKQAGRKAQSNFENSTIGYDDSDKEIQRLSDDIRQSKTIEIDREGRKGASVQDDFNFAVSMRAGSTLKNLEDTVASDFSALLKGEGMAVSSAISPLQSLPFLSPLSDQQHTPKYDKDSFGIASVGAGGEEKQENSEMRRSKRRTHVSHFIKQLSLAAETASFFTASDLSQDQLRKIETHFRNLENAISNLLPHNGALQHNAVEKKVQPVRHVGGRQEARAPEGEGKSRAHK